ncbi:MAG: hypothetical protein IPK99_11690 [Flavobacteriales bacterium]|nr:hypothetical protein [Flavobacteriales bacterium]
MRPTFFLLLYCSMGAPVMAQEFATDAAIFPNGALTDYFGTSIAVDGDRMAVGAPRTGVTGAAEAGAVYLYRWNGDLLVWEADGSVEQQPDPLAGMEFGTRIALGNDRLVVASTYGCADGSCSLLVYQRQGDDDWQYLGELIVPAALDGGSFGAALAMDGDRLAIGGGYEGARECVALYDLSTGLASVHVILEDSLLAGADQGFGASLALLGDFLFVGSPGDDLLGMDAGAVQVHSRNIGGPDMWGLARKVLASNGAAGDRFGTAVAVDQDFAAATAYGLPGSNTDGGRVYLFGKDVGFAGNWGEIGFAEPQPVQPASRFGSTMDVKGDLVVVGAPEEDQGSSVLPEDGAIHIFQRSTNGTGVSHTQRIGASTDQEHFGNAVAFTSHGLVAGAPWNGSESGDDGIVRVFRTSAVGVVDHQQRTATVAPNPFQGSFQVHMPPVTQGSSEWRLRDQRGTLVAIGTIAAGTTAFEVVRDEWSSGLYLLTVTDHRGVDLLQQRLIAE